MSPGDISIGAYSIMNDVIHSVGTIVKLKKPCLKNYVGALGVIFYDYNDGVQVIFENGEYDGFSFEFDDTGRPAEFDEFLEVIGPCEELSGYRFRSVMQVFQDFCSGVFDKAFKKMEKKKRVIRYD